MATSNVKGSPALDEADALEELLNIRGALPPEPTLPPHVATGLGEQLQVFYAHLMSEPVPERFIQLLARLDRDGSTTDGE